MRPGIQVQLEVPSRRRAPGRPAGGAAAAGRAGGTVWLKFREVPPAAAARRQGPGCHVGAAGRGHSG